MASYQPTHPATINNPVTMLPPQSYAPPPQQLPPQQQPHYIPQSTILIPQQQQVINTHRVFQFTVLLCVNLVVSILVSSMWKAMCCMLTLIAKYVLSQFDKAQQDEGNLV